MPPRAPASRAYTLIEILLALLLVLTLGLMGTSTYRTVFRRSYDRAGTLTLSMAQLEGRRVAQMNSSKFPLDAIMVSQMSTAGVQFVIGSAASAFTTPDALGSTQQISVHQLDDNTVVYALVTSHNATYNYDSCLVVVDRLDAPPGWARSSQVIPLHCTATNASVYLPQAVGTSGNPASIVIP